MVKFSEKTQISETKRKKNEITNEMRLEMVRFYLEQKKYSKAIQAYEILKLRVPEKSLIFAARIEALRNQ